MIVEVGLIHLRQRIAQLLRHTRLIRSHLTRSIANALLQLRQVVGELLPFTRQPVALAEPRHHAIPVHRAGVALLAGGELVDAVRLRTFLLRQPVRLMRQRVHLARGKLLLRPAQQVRRLAQLVRRLPRCLGALLRTTAALHRFIRLAQPAQCLLDPLIRRLP